MTLLMDFRLFTIVVGLLGVTAVSQSLSDGVLFKPSRNGSTLDAFGNASISISRLFSTQDHLGSLFSRQEQTCEYPVPCDGDEWCCPAGSNCVSTCNMTPDRKELTVV